MPAASGLVWKIGAAEPVTLMWRRWDTDQAHASRNERATRNAKRETQMLAVTAGSHGDGVTEKGSSGRWRTNAPTLEAIGVEQH